MSCESCEIESGSRWIWRVDWIEGGMGRLTETGERYMEKNFKLDDMIRIMKESHDFSARYIISLFFFSFFFLFSGSSESRSIAWSIPPPSPPSHPLRLLLLLSQPCAVVSKFLY